MSAATITAAQLVTFLKTRSGSIVVTSILLCMCGTITPSAKIFGPEAGGTLSDAQIDAILKDNAKSYRWDKVGETATKVNLIRTDNRARAEVAKPNYQADEGRIKLTTTGAELIIRARP